MLENLSLQSEAFGLDISDTSLKIIKLKKNGKFLDLASFGEMPVGLGTIEGGKIKDEKALTKNIKDALNAVKGEKIRTKYVIASIPEENTFLQVVQMPKMKEEDIKKAVYFEAENYVPLQIDTVYLDSQVIPSVSNHQDHLDVLITALSKKIIDPYVSCLKGAGLIPRALEIESLAIARSLIKNEISPTPVFLMDIGATRTSIIIFSGYSVRFTSFIPISSQKFTQAIAQTLKIDLAKAEDLKIKYGFQKKDSEESVRVFESLIPPFTDLVEQVKKHIGYYQTHASHEHSAPDNKGVSKIYLCGGGANLKGFTDFLSTELKLPVELGNPWINVLPKPLKEVPGLPYEESLGYATALGLALRGIKEK